MKKQLFIIMLFATVFICADFQRDNQLGQDIVDTSDTARDLLGSAFGMVSGAVEETGERLMGDRIEIQRDERQPRKIRKINGTYRQIK